MTLSTEWEGQISKRHGVQGLSKRFPPATLASNQNEIG